MKLLIKSFLVDDWSVLVQKMIICYWWVSWHEVEAMKWINTMHYSDVIMSAIASQNHRRLGYLHNRLFRRRSKKISKLRVTGLYGGIHQRPVNSSHKGPVTRKIFPFDDVIIARNNPAWQSYNNYVHDPRFRPFNHNLQGYCVSTETIDFPSASEATLKDMDKWIWIH